MAFKTKDQLTTEIALLLASGSNIQASEHRAVAQDIVDSMGQGWVKDGSNVSLEDDTDSVGIGVSSPTEKLQIAGGVRVDTDTPSGTAIFSIVNGNPSIDLTASGSIGTTGIAISETRFILTNADFAGAVTVRILSTTDGDLVMQTEGSDGNVGIGTGTPTAKLHVDGTVLLEGVPAYDDDAAAGGGGLTTGRVYQTTGSGAAPLDVAGILMIKQ